MIYLNGMPVHRHITPYTDIYNLNKRKGTSHEEE
jgi:hypothetical protein